ncbi:alpha/beta hydrolase [Lactonifactor longoviformis]|uniref:alpha/beta hydrolase n=1 Tax=Lactonifactor longoviformis TaxID=341220 RepID=UPI0036F37744
MKKKWIKRIGIVFTVLLVLLFAAAYILVDVALVPASMEKTQAFEDITEESVAALVHTDDIQENRSKAYSKTEVWLSAAPQEELEAESTDGYKLKARVFYQKEESHKWVLLLHGYTGWKEEMNPIACEYALKGYQVLTPDMRCQGESEGDFIGMGWTDRADNMIWIRYILQQDPQAEIVIHGQSMGASCALMMSGEKMPDNVKAVVSDCAYTDVYSIFKKQIREWFHLPPFPLLDAANVVLQMRGGYNIKEASAVEQVRKTSLPVLIIHGSEDAFIPVEMAKELYQAAAGEKELLIVEGAGHAQSQDKDPEAYYGAVFSFTDNYVSGGE